MKYNIYPKVVKMLLKKPINTYLNEQHNSLLTKDYKRRVSEEYKNIILRTEGLGGVKNNQFEMTLMLAAYPIAIYKCSNGLISNEIFSEIIDAICSCKAMKNMSKKKKAFSGETIKGRIEAAKKTQESKYKNDWLTTFSYEEGSQEYFITHTKCGVCSLAKQENVLHLVKYMCKMDYPAFEYQGVVLKRTKTLGYEEDDCCDFHVMTKEKANEIGFVRDSKAK